MIAYFSPTPESLGLHQEAHPSTHRSTLRQSHRPSWSAQAVAQQLSKALSRSRALFLRGIGQGHANAG
ncbi:MAG: hypothetical protein RLZZ352_2219 [Pseudomonadota bacterium]|jgi:hypothetical protein